MMMMMMMMCNYSAVEDGCLLGCSAMKAGMSLPTFWKSLLPPHQGADDGGSTDLCNIGNSYQSTWHCNPEDSHLCTYCHESLKSYNAVGGQYHCEYNAATYVL
jgi:hypothetical protein